MTLKKPLKSYFIKLNLNHLNYRFRACGYVIYHNSYPVTLWIPLSVFMSGVCSLDLITQASVFVTLKAVAYEGPSGKTTIFRLVFPLWQQARPPAPLFSFPFLVSLWKLGEETTGSLCLQSAAHGSALLYFVTTFINPLKTLKVLLLMKCGFILF